MDNNEKKTEWIDTVHSRLENKFRTFIKSLNEGVIATDKSGLIELMNPEAEKLTGWSNAEAFGKHVDEVFIVVNEQTRLPMENPVRIVLKDGNATSLSNHSVLMSRNGLEHHIKEKGTPVKDDEGTLQGVILLFFDQNREYKLKQAVKKSKYEYQSLSKTALDFAKNRRKKIEAQLRETNEYLTNLFTYANAPIIVWDNSFLITHFNHAFEDLSGYTADEVIGRKIDILFPVENVDEYFKHIKRTTHEGERWESVEICIKRKDGNIRIVLWNSANILDSDGKTMISTIAHGNDITERKIAEAEINKLTEELEQKVIMRTAQLQAANEELESFSFSVSHDLRAPLRAIHDFARILAEDYGKNLDDEGNRLCSIIESSATRMEKLIDDLLTFSRLGNTDLFMTKIDMMSEVMKVFHELLPSYPSLKVKLNLINIPSGYGDPVMVRQVIVNLISNALKYSSKNIEAEIEIGVRESAEGTTYYIKDNGVGFDMKYVNKLFGMFQRLHTSSEFEGNGVGLAISRRIISRHNGKIWAEGEVGKGAVFYFTLRVNQAGA